MGYQTWLVDVLRGAGLTVREVSGWRTRSAAEDVDASTFAPRGLIIHETRGSATSTDAGEIGVLVNGRVGLSGPIAQLYLSRTGEWWVVAAGLCHHVRTGWGGPFTGLGNSRLLGIEPAHAQAEDWANKPAQYRSYVRGVAAILRHTGWPPPVGHKEHQPGDKPDPEFDMNIFRADVERAIAGDDMTAEQTQNLLAEGWSILTGAPASVIPYEKTGLKPVPIGNPLWDMLRAIAAKVDVDADELAAITAAARAGAEAGVLGIADDLVAAILAGLPEGTLTRDDVEAASTAAVRRVLGSLDEPAG